MFLQLRVHTKTQTLTPKINLGEWYLIYIAFIETHGGFGTAFVSINGAEGVASARTTSAYGYQHFSNQDTMYIGSGLIGRLRRVQIFSPATAHLQQGSILHCVIILIESHRRLCSLFL